MGRQKQRRQKKSRPGSTRSASTKRKRRIGVFLLAASLMTLALWLFLANAARATLPNGFPDLPHMAELNSSLVKLLSRADTQARKDPDKPEALGRLAMVYHVNLFFERARTCYRLAADLAPGDHRWWYYQALLEEESGGQEELVRLLEKCAQLRPSFAPGPLKLGDVFFKQGQPELARKAYLRVYERDNSFVPAALALARLTAQQQNWASVLHYVEPVVRQHPRLRRAHQLLRQAYEGLGRSEDAFREHRVLAQSNLITVLRMGDPLRDDLNALCRLSTPLLKLAYAAESEADFEKMLQLSRLAVEAEPGDAHAHHFFSRALVRAHAEDLKVIEKALDHRDQGLRLNPDDVTPLLLLAEVFLELNNLDAAVAQLEALLQREPQHEGAHNTLGIALFGQARLAESTAHFSKALRLKPDYAEAHSNLGNVLAKQGKWTEAFAHFREALRLRPDYAGAHYNLGSALAARGSFSQARKHFLEVLRLNPDYAEAYNEVGVIALRQKRLEEAIVHLSEALRLMPNSAGTHYNLALAFARKGKFEDSVEHLSEALRIKPDFGQAEETLRRVLDRQPDGISRNASAKNPGNLYE